jgi:hypothetical protein
MQYTSLLLYKYKHSSNRSDLAGPRSRLNQGFIGALWDMMKEERKKKGRIVGPDTIDAKSNEDKNMSEFILWKDN